jgi:hypothetical protein
MLDFFRKKKPPKRFPPVPDWRPAIVQPLSRIIERMHFYLGKERDFAVFGHGTCVVVESGLSDEDAIAAAKVTLDQIFRYHPDMNPQRMEDGNILVTYNHPAFNVVLADIVAANWHEIDRRHQQALATDEVLMTPRGPNIFDDFGKKALFGRCYMFMDADAPNVVQMERIGL